MIVAILNILYNLNSFSFKGGDDYGRHGDRERRDDSRDQRQSHDPRIRDSSRPGGQGRPPIASSSGYSASSRDERGGYGGGDRDRSYDNRSGFQGENRSGFQGENRGGYQGENRGGYQGENRGGYQGENRGGYQGENRGGFQGGGRGGFSGIFYFPNFIYIYNFKSIQLYFIITDSTLFINNLTPLILFKILRI
jgi:hypothetical protein